MDAKIEALDTKMDSLKDTMNTRFDNLRDQQAAARRGWVQWSVGLLVGLIGGGGVGFLGLFLAHLDRKSTPLYSSHTVISYFLLCLTKKNTRSVVSVLLV